MTRSEQFYHGTNQEIRGDTLLPGGGTYGVPNHADDFRLLQHSRQGVFSTPNEHEAWLYASMSKGRPNTRAHVLTVEPTSDARPGDYGEERIASSAKVTGRVDIMPGRQGTFPNLNWAQFAGEHARSREGGMSARAVSEFNHPSDEAIEKGHTRGPEPGVEMDEMRSRLKAKWAAEEEDPLRDHPRLF